MRADTIRGFFQAGAIYLVLVLVIAWPLLPKLSTHIIGNGGDPWQTLWRLANTEERLTVAWRAGEVGRFLQQEFFGSASPQLVNLSAWLWQPLQFMFGEVVTYNILWLLSYIGSGLAMYALVSYLLHRYRPDLLRRQVQAAAGVAGLYFMLVPYHVAQSFGHFGAMHMEWLPLIILLGYKFQERATLAHALLFVFLLTIQAWMEHHYILWLGLLGILLVVWRWRETVTWLRHNAPYAVLTILLTFMFVVLPYVPTLRLAGSNTAALALGQEQTIRFSMDAVAPLIPASFHTLWGTLFDKVHWSGNATESTHYVGLIPLLLILYFWPRIPRTQRVWWSMVCALFFLIALGPRLNILGWRTAVPMPYAIIDQLPIFSAVRVVARAAVMSNIALAVLLGWVVALQPKRLSLTWLVAGFIMVEFLFIPVPLQSAKISPAYDVVSMWPGSALVEIPVATDYASASSALYATLRHGKDSLANIALERGQVPNEATKARALPSLRYLLYLKSADLIQGRPDFFNQSLAETLPDVLRYVQASTIMVHTNYLSSQQNISLQKFLERDVRLEPVLVDDVRLYDAAPLFRPEALGDGIFLSRDQRWKNVAPENDTLAFDMQFTDTASFTIHNLNINPLVVTVGFVIGDASVADLSVSAAVPRPDFMPQLKGDRGSASISTLARPGDTTITLHGPPARAVVLRNAAITTQAFQLP